MRLNNLGGRVIILVLAVFVSSILGGLISKGLHSVGVLKDSGTLVSALNEQMGSDLSNVSYSQQDLIEFSKNLLPQSSVESHINSIKLNQAISSIFLFIVSSILICVMYKVELLNFLKLKGVPHIKYFIFAILAISVSFPFIGFTGEVNQMMQIPFVELEVIIKKLEYTATTFSFLIGSSSGTWSLITSLIVMALIPAIGEELIFRGIIQRNLVEFNWNYHKAIWLTAFIFSAIHFQFYGFLPRFFLGVILGYLFHWSNSIWVPIVGHFVQNATSVLLLSLYMNDTDSIISSDIESGSINPFALLSLSAVIAILYKFHKEKTEFVVEANKNFDI